MSAPALSPPESCDTASMPRPDSPTATWNPDAGAGSRGDPLLPPGRLFADRYEVRELLGTGGSAQVFRAWDRTLRREVALKVLRPETAGANARRRLAREAALARDVESPHLLRVFDVGEAEGLAFLILELLPGGSLRDRLRSGPLPVGEAVEIGRQLLSGLAALHAARIVHRDVKPSNVLFTAAGEAKLGDLGVALPLAADETRATSMGALLGTIDYLSPEQALGHEADERSDLFAVGLVLHEMLTGDLPFVRDGSAATLLARLRQPAPAVRHRCPEAPRWLDALVARLLEADPRRRPQSAEAVLADLRARRFRLPSHRRRRLLAAVAAGGALLAAAGLTWQHERAGFSRLAVLGEGADPGMVAVDRAGRELWRLPEVAATVARNSTLARLVPGEPPRLVAALHRHHDYRPESTLQLTALDTATGTVVDRIDLRAGQFEVPFPGYAVRYAPGQIVACDLDRDGIDELLIGYHHVRSWPAFTILYEPRQRRSRIAYRSAGHERFAAAHDLDGDGHPELLFTGINSLLGSYPVATAVRLFPPVAEEGAPGKKLVGGAFGPGTGQCGFSASGLLWQRLLPRGVIREGPGAIRFDPAARHLEIAYEEQPPVVLRFDGSRPGEAPLATSPETPPAARALLDFEEALRLAGGEAFERALAAAARGKAAARAAGDPLLVECLDRLAARLLAAAGRTDEAERAFRDLVATTESPAEVAYDAARALHLAGEPERALPWYRESLRTGVSRPGALNPIFALEGVVFALVELGRPGEALAELDRFEALHGGGLESAPGRRALSSAYRFFVAWRAGEPVPSGLLFPADAPTDYLLYLGLEARRVTGTPPAELLATVEAGLTEASVGSGLFLALRAELLAELGRSPEARAEIVEALDLVRLRRQYDIPARGLLPVVEARYQRLVGSRG